MFELEIATDNEASGDDEPFGARIELARILRRVADDVENSTSPHHAVLDFNGNTVGTWVLWVLS